jgi:hypothetical protein
VTDPGFAIDVALDYFGCVVIVRGLVAIAFDIRRGWRALKTWWRWGTWA